MSQSTIEQDAGTTLAMPTPPVRRRPNRRSRRIAAATALALLGAGAVAFLGTAGSDTSKRHAGGAGPEVAVAAAPAPAPAPEPTPAPADKPADTTPTPPPTTPPPAPGHLVVSTGHVNLGINVFTGSFEVRNDGGSASQWTWSASHPAISAAPANGVLQAGEAVVVTVTVHWQQLGNGGFNFPTKVTADGQELNVLVSGTRNVLVNPGVQVPQPQIKP